MQPRPRLWLSFLLAVVLSTTTFAKNLPNIDAFGAKKGKGNANADIVRKGNARLRKGAPVQSEPRLGVPTFVWFSQAAELSGGHPGGNSNEKPEVANARAHLGAVADIYGLSAADVSNAIVDTVINTGRGPVIVKFKQQVNGVDIFREELNVVMNQKFDAIGATGYISRQNTPAAQPGHSTWTLQPANAGLDAIDDATDVSLGAAQLQKTKSADGYDYYEFAHPVPGVTLETPVRMKQVYFHLPEGLVPAYSVEVVTTNATSEAMIDRDIDESAYLYVISAVDGLILFRKNLIDSAGPATPAAESLPPGGFTYRVWADPVTGIPYDTPAGNGVDPKLVPLPDGTQYPFVAPNDVTLPNFPFSMNDPWLAPGATETNGNNVDAFVNLFSPDDIGSPTTTTPVDPPNGDHRAQITGADQFLHTHQPDVDGYSVSARSASITQLFYNINFLHDWFYDAGFNEAARNGQKNNYGRGGLQNDDIKGQAQDFQSFNNANMLTLADGGRSRMRMYNFPSLSNTLDLQAPAAIAGKLRIGISQTGLRNFDVTGNVVIATFTAGPSTCTITNAAALTGNIAMFDFDNTDGTGCAFTTRIARIHATGAVAALMVYTSGGPTLVANITGVNATHTKPVAVISWNSAAPIKTQLAGAATVTARLLRVADRDGALDNQVVFHEWGHFLSNRLIGNAAGLNNQQGGGMGEGWGDFLGMLLTVRQTDTAVPSNANWGGVYSLATYATSGVPYDGSLNHGYYLGIRRTPYSTDMANYNALTFKHIQDGQPLPSGPPIASGGLNSEVHNTGEVWATMLWECYASLLRDTLGANPRLTFQQAQDRMKQYLVASLAMTPSSPTFLEARDAVLAAAYATDATDYLLFLQAFAKRGAGIYAVAPDRFSTNQVGVVESYEVMPEISFTGTTLDDTVASCDNDGSIDSGEAGKLTVQLKNVGSTTLIGTVATITSTTPGVSFPFGNTINFPSSDPLATISGSLTVAFAPGVAGVQQLDFHIAVNDPQLAGARTQDIGFRANVNTIPAASATDTVESTTNPWTLDSDITLSPDNPWKRVIVVPLDREWHVDNAGAASDQRLMSPVFTVDGSGSMNLQFDHSWSFEFDASANYDGGVVEMQVNGGAWVDIGTPIYNGTLANYTGNLNPLKLRNAVVKTGSAHASLTQPIAPGSTVRIRFRIGTDNAAGAPGWNVDNIAFTGVVETPFGVAVADPGCALPTSTLLGSSANPSPFGSPLTLTATVSATGALTPSGSVTFYDGATPIGSSALVSGVATLINSTLTVGAHTLSATFTGATGFLPSSSPSLPQTISKVATTTDVISSNIVWSTCSPVTFTATVTSTSGTPTGSVTFLDGATTLATVSLTAGVATYTTSSLSIADHTITASYGGTSTFATSTDSLVQSILAPAATPSASNGGPYCENGTIALSTPLVTGGTYAWSGPNGFTSALREPTIGSATIAMSGTYSVTVTANGCTSTAGTTDVTVNPIPATPSASNSGPYCENGTIALSTADVPGATYAWTGPNGFTSALREPTISNATPAMSGSYSVTVTVGTCPSLAGSTNVVVNALPATPTITPLGPTAFCGSGSVILQSSSATGNQWYLNGSPIGGATNQQYTATAVGDYTVVVTTTGCSSSPSTATTITSNTPPDATITAPASVVAASTGNAASVANAGAGATYNWSITGGTITSGAGTNAVTFTAGAAGSLSLQVTVQTLAGCTDTKSANVTVTAAAPVVTVTSVAPTSVSWTGGDPITINGTGFASGATVTIGGNTATNVVVVNATQITCTTPAHAVGAVNVTVTNTDASTGTLTNGLTYKIEFDANNDNTIDPSDIFYLVNYLFLGGPAPSGPGGVLSGDANGDGVVDPADIFYLVNYLFSTGPAPAAKSPNVAATSIDNTLEGSLVLGAPVVRGGRTFVPVILKMAPGAVTPQSVSLRVVSSVATELSIRRAGVAAGVQPIFEISRTEGNAVSYLVAFNGALATADGGAVIAEVELSSRRAAAHLDFDPALTLLADERGTRKATVAAGSLRVEGVTVNGRTDRESKPAVNPTRGEMH